MTSRRYSRVLSSTASVVASTVAVLALLLAVTSRDVRASIIDYEEEDEIIVLNATNFDKALAEFKYLFVEFCEYSRLIDIVRPPADEVRCVLPSACRPRSDSRCRDARWFFLGVNLTNEFCT